MNKILVLGAGLVSRPGVRYMLQQPDLHVTVASRTVSKAEKLVKGFSNGRALHINVRNTEELELLIKKNDITVSLLPWIHHQKVADLCLKQKKHMVTTSYVNDEMKKNNQEVKEKGLLFLNEIGVDPGIDHMSAMKIIDGVHADGGKVLHFHSYTGGLPAPEDNDNPFGYKFSWSPKGVVLASRNPARYLLDRQIIDIPGQDLFLNYFIEEVEGLGKFEVYPNRDSMPYQALYGLKDAQTIMRGTYRNLGWCDTFKKIVDLGLIQETPVKKGTTYIQMMADLVGISVNNNILLRTAEKVGLDSESEIMKRLEWLGLFSTDPIPDCDNHLDVLSHRLLEKLFYKEGEKDMIVMQHKFTVENRNKSQHLITSTLIDFGIPFGDSSMARTVSLPLAIGVKLIAEGKIKLTGVQIPTEKEIYEPILDELANLNIKMDEKRIELD